jgi:hypothetical protein
MEIKDAQYFKDIITGNVSSIRCIVDGRHTSIPTDTDNTDYAEILKQVEEGTLTIKDAD